VNNKVDFLIQGLRIKLDENGKIKVGYYAPPEEWLSELEKNRQEVLAELRRRETAWNQAGRPKYFIIDQNNVLLLLGKYRWRPKRGSTIEITKDADGTPVINYVLGVPKTYPWDLWIKSRSITCQTPKGYENYIPYLEVSTIFDEMRQKKERYRIIQLRRYHPDKHIVSWGGHHD